LPVLGVELVAIFCTAKVGMGMQVSKPEHDYTTGSESNKKTPYSRISTFTFHQAELLLFI
jgi:hypothetical protein